VVASVRYKRPAGGSSGGGALLRVLAKVYFCQDGDVCLFEEVCFDAPLADVREGAAADVPLDHVLSAQAPVAQFPGL
jgi:hypothetical protein